MPQRTTSAPRSESAIESSAHLAGAVGGLAWPVPTDAGPAPHLGGSVNPDREAREDGPAEIATSIHTALGGRESGLGASSAGCRWNVWSSGRRIRSALHGERPAKVPRRPRVPGRRGRRPRANELATDGTSPGQVAPEGGPPVRSSAVCRASAGGQESSRRLAGSGEHSFSLEAADSPPHRSSGLPGSSSTEQQRCGPRLPDHAGQSLAGPAPSRR